MKRFIFITVIFLIGCSSLTVDKNGYAKELFFPEQDKYQIAETPSFFDEFNSDSLDQTKWTINRRLRFNVQNTEQALEFSGNSLKINYFYDKTEKVHKTGYITTKGEDKNNENKFLQTYGYFTARVKLKTKPGTWCAFWLMNLDAIQSPENSQDPTYGPHDGAEIDIMEYIDSAKSPTKNIYHTIHWDYGKKTTHKNVSSSSKIKNIDSGWHIFSLLWTPEHYYFYVDNILTFKTDKGISHAPCDVRLSMESFGDKTSWAGTVDKTKLPDTFEIDYIRVYPLKTNPAE